MIRNILSIILLIGILVNTFAQEIGVPYVQSGHTKAIGAINFSPDGRYILSASDDNTLKVWEISTGLEVWTMELNQGHINHIAVSQDGKKALTASEDKTIKLWDLEKGNEIYTLKDHIYGVRSVAFSPDSQFILSGSIDKTLKLWSVSTGNLIQTMKGHYADITSVAFSSDGQFAISASADSTIKLWDLKIGKDIRTLKGNGKPGYVQFNSDDSEIISSDYCINGQNWENCFKFWNTETGELLNTFYGKPFSSSARFSNNGQHALFRYAGKTIVLWDIKANRKIWSKDYDELLYAMALSPDEKYAILAGQMSEIKLLAIDTGEELQKFEGKGNKIISTSFNPDGDILAIGVGNTIRLLDLFTSRVIKTFKAHDESVYAVNYSHDGRYILSGSQDASMKLWNANSGKLLKKMTGHDQFISDVAFCPDEKRVASASCDDTIKLWSVSTGKLEKTIKGHSSCVNKIVFSLDGKYLLSGSDDNTLKLWSTSSGKLIRTFEGHTGAVNAIAISDDSKYAISGSEDSNIKLWDLITGKELQTYSGHAAAVTALVFSKDGKSFLSGSDDQTIKFWDISSKKETETIRFKNHYISTVSFDPHEKYIFVGSTQSLKILDMKTHKELVSTYFFQDGEWVTITPEGYFDASAEGGKYLNFLTAPLKGSSINAYYETFYRPDLVKLALGGGSLADMRNIASVKPAPSVEIINTPETTTQNEATITLKMKDMGGGIGDVRLYVNGSAVMLDNSRALKRVSDGTTRTYTIKLSNGKNNIRAIAFNADNSMQSTDALYTITSSFKMASKPNLHAIIVGIQEFKNPKLNLQYPIADAKLFADTLKQSATGLFNTVEITQLTTREETTSENIKAELSKLKKLNPDDLFIFYVASHGTVDDGEYFLVTSNVGITSTQHLKSDALPQNDLKELIANIPTTKKVIVLDTCNSGAMGDTLQKAILTRGMSEDTAIKILSRAVGSTILSASTPTQEALEGYKGHGLFTYVLSEGIKGKADKGKTGFIKTTDLVDYVDTEVPELAEKVFKRAQYPTNTSNGQGFHIGKVVK